MDKRIVVLLIVLLSGCLDTPEEVSYEELLNTVVQEGIPGIVLLVRTPDYRFVGAQGYAHTEESILMNEHQLFRIASTSKLFIGVLATMLHCEQKLDLDDPITKWIPPDITAHIQYADAITIRQLLNHTSGIYDYGENEEFWDAIMADPESLVDTYKALSYAYGQPAYFEPGTNWHYSNTNYVLAGLILDSALGYHHSKAIRSRIVEPLQLTSTYYACYDNFEGEIVHGYADIDRDGILDDISFIDQGHCLADAGLLSTVEDLAVFIESLFTQGFPDPGYNPEFMKALLPEGDDFYGLGILKYPTAYGTAYGNGGHFIGYESGVMYFPDHGVTIVYFVNSTGSRSNRIVDDFLDRLLKKVMNS